MSMVSEPLSQPLHLVGHGTVRLYLTINAPEDAPMAAPTKDVLIHAIISDVETAAGGQTQTKTQIVSDGQLRGIGRKAGVQHMPYRDVTAWRSFRERDAVPVRTNKMFVADVSLAPTAHTFQPGHRVGLSVQVSSFHTDQPGWHYSVHVGGLGGSYVEFPGEPILDPDDPRARQGNVRRERDQRSQRSQSREHGEEQRRRRRRRREYLYLIGSNALIAHPQFPQHPTSLPPTAQMISFFSVLILLIPLSICLLVHNILILQIQPEHATGDRPRPGWNRPAREAHEQKKAVGGNGEGGAEADEMSSLQDREYVAYVGAGIPTPPGLAMPVGN
jgi:hypothetical protein